MTPRAQAIHKIWFGEIGPDGGVDSRYSARWFTRDPQFDALLRRQFRNELNDGAKGKLVAWRADPRGGLALILLFDQFARNMYRGTADAYAYDASAMAECRHILDGGSFEALCEVERYFALMPLTHAEDLTLQREGFERFDKLAASASPVLQEMLNEAADYAAQHLVIIERFGRFPHRNASLGRESTSEERDYLAAVGNPFD